MGKLSGRVAIALLVLVACAPANYTSDLEGLSGRREIIAAVFTELVRHSPSLAIFSKDRSHDADPMDDLSSGEFDKFYARMNFLSDKMATIDPTTVQADEQLPYDEALANIALVLGQQQAKAQLWEVSSTNDVQDIFAQLPAAWVIRNKTDVDNLIGKYQGMPRYLSQRTANLDQGINLGLTASQAIVKAAAVNAAFYGEKTTDPDGSVFAHVNFDASVSLSDQLAWQQEINAAVDSTVAPAMMQYYNYLSNRLLPRARLTYGYGALGDLGVQYFNAWMQFNLGTSITPDQIMQLGEQRLQQWGPLLQQQLAILGINAPTLGQELALASALPDAQPAYSTDIVAEANRMIDVLRASNWAGAVWGMNNLPACNTQTLSLVGAARYIQASSTMQIYTRDCPVDLVTPVVTHEFTHYMQDTATQALSAQANQVTPYVPSFPASTILEGQALYAEKMAIETYPSLYDKQDPVHAALTRVQALSLLMMRAVRMVLDPAIHLYGMSRDEAIAFFKQYVLKTDAGVQAEVDRYASYPTQSLTYLLGAEEIQTQHDRAQAALGANFDDTAFNNMLLTSFGGRLRLLQIQTDTFIAQH